jgi:hypothetical protein
MLHAFASEFLAYIGEERFAGFAIVGKHANLDQCMRSERVINFVQH